MKNKKLAVPTWNPGRERWELRYQFDGKRKMFTSKKPGRAGASEVKRKGQLWRADPYSVVDPRLDQAVALYLDDVISRRGPGSNSWRSAESALRLYVLPSLGHRKIETITVQHLQRLLGSVRKSDGSYLSKKTVSNIKSEINLLWKFLRKSGYTDLRTEDLEVPSFLMKKEKETLTPEDVTVLLSDQTLDPYLLAWQFQLLYGLRPGEVLGLQVQDFSESFFVVNRSLNVRREITPGKNKNARRSFGLFELSNEILERAKKYKKQVVLESEALTPFVFVSSSGSHLDPVVSTRKLHEYCARKGITDITPYRLRHSLASLAKHSLTDLELKSVLGHSASMDSMIYVHALESDHAVVSQKLDRLFSDLLAENS